MFTPTSIKNKRYVLKKETIGDNAENKVHLAYDTLEQREVVVKLIQGETLNQFESDAQRLRQLRHPNIVEIYDQGIEQQGNDKFAYLVMRYYKDGSLSQWFRKRTQRLQLEEVATLLERAAKPVQFLHGSDERIVHRDIKPPNFLIECDPKDPAALPTLFLADFGQARYVNGATERNSQGTSWYKAPEQWKAGDPKPATDQYALAVMAYFLLTGTHPFNSKDNLQVMQQHANARVPAPSSRKCPHISPAVDGVILRALRKREKERYPSVDAFVKAFRKAIKPQPVPVALLQRGINFTKRDRPRWIRRAVMITYMLLALLIIIPIYTLTVGAISSASTNCNSNSALYANTQPNTSIPNTNPFVNAPGIKDTQTDQYGNVIGLSAGTTILDPNGPNSDEMQQGASALQANDTSGALSHFGAASSSNAEAAIYWEDLNVLKKTPNNYVAVVLGMDITSGRTSSARESMQGAYLAQKAYNDNDVPQDHCPPLVVILANSGAIQTNTTWVAQQIVTLKKANNHVIGVIGWSISADSLDANAILASQTNASDNVFMLAPSASSTHLTGNPNFLRIVSSDTEQAQVMANYAFDKLHYKKIAILYTTLDNYSVSLDSAFKNAFQQKGGTVIEQLYTQEDRPSVKAALDNALASNPDAIYFSGFPDDAGPMLDLPEITDLNENFLILGGDGLASLGNYPPNQQNQNRLIVTSWTSQDEWDFLHVQQSSSISTFTSSYNSTFNNTPIGPNTMLVYDAVNVFLRAYQKATVNDGTNTCVPCALQNAFQSMNDTQAYQGVTGQIAFASSSTEPIKKVVLIDKIVNGELTTVDYRGCFQVGGSDCKN